MKRRNENDSPITSRQRNQPTKQSFLFNSTSKTNQLPIHTSNTKTQDYSNTPPIIHNQRSSLYQKEPREIDTLNENLVDHYIHTNLNHSNTQTPSKNKQVDFVQLRDRFNSQLNAKSTEIFTLYSEIDRLACDNRLLQSTNEDLEAQMSVERQDYMNERSKDNAYIQEIESKSNTDKTHAKRMRLEIAELSKSNQLLESKLIDSLNDRKQLMSENLEFKKVQRELQDRDIKIGKTMDRSVEHLMDACEEAMNMIQRIDTSKLKMEKALAAIGDGQELVESRVYH